MFAPEALFFWVVRGKNIRFPELQMVDVAGMVRSRLGSTQHTDTMTSAKIAVLIH